MWLRAFWSVVTNHTSCIGVPLASWLQMFVHTCWSNWRGHDEAWAGALQSHGRSSSTCIPLTEVNHSLTVSGALNSDFFKIESSAWGLSITKFVDPFIHHCHLYPCYFPFISIYPNNKSTRLLTSQMRSPSEHLRRGTSSWRSTTLASHSCLAQPRISWVWGEMATWNP